MLKVFLGVNVQTLEKWHRYKTLNIWQVVKQFSYLRVIYCYNINKNTNLTFTEYFLCIVLSLLISHLILILTVIF